MKKGLVEQPAANAPLIAHRVISTRTKSASYMLGRRRLRQSAIVGNAGAHVSRACITELPYTLMWYAVFILTLYVFSVKTTCSTEN